MVAATNRNLEDLVARRPLPRGPLLSPQRRCYLHGPAPRAERRFTAARRTFPWTVERRFHQDVRGVDTTVQTELSRYRWPGNVRELRNMLEATCVSMPGPTIYFEHLPELYQRRFTETSEAPAALSERHRLLEVLNATHWNKSKAAEQLRWSRVTLYRKLARYGISDPREDSDVCAHVRVRLRLHRVLPRHPRDRILLPFPFVASAIRRCSSCSRHHRPGRRLPCPIVMRSSDPSVPGTTSQTSGVRSEARLL